ncbi:Retrovirus-related Pol polyprotein from transposon 17.6, partial [Mucuna pruriens]
MSVVTFIGFVVGSHRVKVDEEKVKAFQDWPTPKTVGEVSSFHGLESQERAFQVLKEILTQAPILTLLEFSKSFELECDASSVGIGVVILQEGNSIAYFSEKLRGTQLNYSTYDGGLYALVRALQTWQHYLLPKEFVMYSDHEALKHERARKRLCVPMSSIRKLLVKKAHEGGFMGHFGELKTSKILNEQFYWPHMRKTVHNICEICLTCKLANSRVSPHGLYTPLPIPTSPWIDVSMDFILGFPRSKGGTQALNLRSNSLQEEGDDAYMGGHIQEGENEIDTPTLEGPMTRGRLKRIQEEVQQEMIMLKGQERGRRRTHFLSHGPKPILGHVFLADFSIANRSLMTLLFPLLRSQVLLTSDSLA